jgi:hypothetical protein
MKRVILLAIVPCLFLISNAVAVEPGDTLWTRTYGGYNEDESYAVAEVSDAPEGGFIVAGRTNSYGAGYHDFYLIRTYANGDTIWIRTYGGDQRDYGWAVAVTPDGCFAVAGQTASFGAGREDVWLLKIDADGDTLWTRTYGGGNADIAYSVAVTADSGFILGGYTDPEGSDRYDVLLIRTDLNGDVLWTRTYGGPSPDYVESVAQTYDGGFIAAGLTESYGAGWQDVYLIRTDANGDTLWTKTYGGPETDKAWSVAQVPDGGFIVAGSTDSYGVGSSDVYLIRTDANGDSLWAITYGGVSFDYGESVALTSDNGFIVSGTTGSYGAGSSDVLLIRTDAHGDLVWLNAYGGTRADRGLSVAQTSDGNFIVAGHTYSYGAGENNVYLLKIAGAEPGVSMDCQALTPIFCRGKNFYFKLTVDNPTGGNVSGTLAFSGYSGHGCDPGHELITIPRPRDYAPGLTEQYYFFKVPNSVAPGQYSASVAGALSGYDLFCCMNVDIKQCQPWKMGSSTGWELVEVHRPEAILPTATSLNQNHPNPFNARTIISYQLPVNGHVKLEVYNLFGQNVATLVNAEQEASYRSVSWDASEVSSGLYFYKLTAGDFSETKRMMLVK